MKKTTIATASAFMKDTPLVMGNTAVVFNGEVTQLQLHGSIIAAKIKGSNEFTIDFCGYKTATTKERLNGLPGVSIQQKTGCWYLNGQLWESGERKIINNQK